MKARVHVTLKNGVLDPQGKAIGHSLNRLGFPEVGDVRQGKYIELELAEPDKATAKARLEDMCRKLLANSNDFQIAAEAVLVPGVLMRNEKLKFVCGDVHLKVETSQSLFTNRYQAGQVIKVPVAHAEGNYFADDDTLKKLEDRGQIAFRYCSADGTGDG